MAEGHTRRPVASHRSGYAGSTTGTDGSGSRPVNGPVTVVPLYRIKRVSIETEPVGFHTVVPLYVETHTPRCRCNELAVGVDSKRWWGEVGWDGPRCGR